MSNIKDRFKSRSGESAGDDFRALGGAYLDYAGAEAQKIAARVAL